MKQEQAYRTGKVIITVLKVIGVAGVISAALVAPNILQLMRPILRNRYSRRSVNRVLRVLDERGWIVYRKHGENVEIYLTKRGLAEFHLYELMERKITRPKRWDGKWHILIFDISERKKYIREKIREILKTLEFQRLQDSVWIHPFECEKILELLRTKYRVRSDALYLLVDRLENDRWLRKFYNLV